MLLRFALLLFLVPSIAKCTNLPSALISVLPSCSLNCLEYYVYEYYPSSICSDTTNLECLCTQNTASGFTIGEAALRCLASSCTNIAPFEVSAYEICSGVSGAVPETHSTLTATVMAATTVIPSSITTTSVSSVPTSIVYNTSSTSISSVSSTESLVTTSTPTPTPTSTSSSMTTNLQPQATTNATSVSSHTGLSSGQIIGISCGGVASAAVSFGLLTIFFCIRRRKKRRDEEKEWPPGDVYTPPPNEASGTSGPSNTSEQATMVGGPLAEGGGTPATEDKRRSYWRKSIKPEEIGVAVSPEIPQQSPVSIKSTKTTSELLPEMPSYSLWPAPLRASQHLDGQNKKSKSAEMSMSDAPRPIRVVSSRSGNGLPTDPRARMYALERHRSQGKIPLTPVYDNGNPDNWPRPTSRPTQNTLPQVYSMQRGPASNYSGWNRVSDQQVPAPAFHLPVPLVQPRASSRYSNTSESTDFEIDDYEYDRDSNDEPLEPSTPRVQRSTFQFRPTLSMLSPVAESPRFSPPRFSPTRPTAEDDPFTSPTTRRVTAWPSAYDKPAAQDDQNSHPDFTQLTVPNPSIRPVIDKALTGGPGKVAKDDLIAEGQSFLVTNATTTPEDENTDISSGSASCSQPSLTTPPEEGAGNATQAGPPRRQPQLLSPFRQQSQAIGSYPRVASPATNPIIPPPRALSPSDSLLAKRRGHGTASSLLSSGLRISPAAANRPRPRHEPRGQALPKPGSVETEDAPIQSMWGAVGRGPYEVARPLPPSHSSSSSADSSKAVIGVGRHVVANPPMSPFATKVTPTRRDNGDMFLKVG